MWSILCQSQRISSEISDVSKKIEDRIHKDFDEEQKKIKILLLGSGDSGKSTIAKQMKILHLKGFNDTEIIYYRIVIFNNLVSIFHHIAKGICQLAIHIPDKEQLLHEQFLNSHKEILHYETDSQHVFLNRFKKFECVEKLLERKTEVFLPDNTEYYLENLDRIIDSNYMPNNIDILNVRNPTTGVYELLFEFKEMTIKLIDVGGQRTERRKWIHFFENITAILFIISLSCYDQSLFEDPKKNALVESYELFHVIYNNKYFTHTAFILFLNKKDLLKKKIFYSPISKHFSDYKGNDNYETAVRYIKKLFTMHVPEDKEFYSHRTNATDTHNIKHVFADTINIIIRENYKKSFK